MNTRDKTIKTLAHLMVCMACLCLPGSLTAQTQQAAPWDTYSDTWVATDALGRDVPGWESTGIVKNNKTVGIFYFLWLETKGPILDLSKMIAANPGNPQYGPKSAFHWWNQPMFGYYRSDDEFVIRKHLQMLSDAGVDVLIFDVTNGPTYEKAYLAICRCIEQLRQSGQKAPRIAFITHSSSDKVIQALYKKFYSLGLHKDTWFLWQGKPLILGPTSGLAEPVLSFFTFRDSWAWTKGQKWFGDGKDKWPWLDHYPQTPGWHADKSKPEEIVVCVAQHPVSNIGRSFHNGKEPANPEPEKGLCFQEQWRRALEVNPEFVFVTGWNEWIAQRFINDKGGQPFLGKPLPPGGTFFVDTYNQEFSRDIEPMKGGHGDNYYYQLVSNIRRYKGARTLPMVKPQPINLDGAFSDWEKVEPEFRDTINDPVKRNHPGCGDVPPYVNDSGRNDIVASKVSYDEANVYFYVRTRESITPCTDPNWMLLYINTDQNTTNGWLGYDMVINRNPGQKTTSLERHDGKGYTWQKSAEVPIRVSGREMEIIIPRSAFGTTLPAWLDFKWADNIKQTGDATDFALNGDAAPNDRFNYRARLR